MPVRIKRHSLFKKFSLSRMVIGIILLFLGIATLYPFWYVMSVSLSTHTAILDRTLLLYPVGITFEAYQFVFTSGDFFKYFQKYFFCGYSRNHIESCYHYLFCIRACQKGSRLPLAYLFCIFYHSFQRGYDSKLSCCPLHRSP